MKKDEPIEVRCDACDGMGRPQVRQPGPATGFTGPRARNAAVRAA
jgi:hypothetical protein